MSTITIIRGLDESAAIMPTEARRLVILPGLHDAESALAFARAHGIRRPTITHQRGRQEPSVVWRPDDYDPTTDELDFS